MSQLDLFQEPSAGVCSSPPAELRRFGIMDARTGLPVRNDYSGRLDTANRAIYEAAYLAEKGAP